MKVLNVTLVHHSNNKTAIRKASRRGLTDVVQLLLNDPRVDPSAGDNEGI